MLIVAVTPPPTLSELKKPSFALVRREPSFGLPSENFCDGVPDGDTGAVFGDLLGEGEAAWTESRG